MYPKKIYFSREFKGIRMNHKECKEIKGNRKETLFFFLKKKEIKGNGKETKIENYTNEFKRNRNAIFSIFFK